MIELAKKDSCTGCSACYSSCPINCISMEQEKNGFLYPIIDRTKCIECGACQKACPILISTTKVNDDQKIFLARSRDRKILSNSSSGGMFYSFAIYVIKQRGVVFGAVCDSDFTVYHKSCSTLEDLKEFQGSKYVQSEIRDTYIEAKKALLLDKFVLFSGTPCQIHGFKRFLGKEYEKLICLDILCRSVPSPLLFKKYVDMQSSKLGKIKSIRFKDKSRGYDYPVLKIDYIDKKNRDREYMSGSESDPWLRLFLSNEGDRPSCEKCIVEKSGYCSDITIGDFNRRSLVPRYMNDNLGCSRVIIRSKKGLKLFNEISDLIDYESIDYIETEKVRPASIQGYKYNKQDFYNDAYVLKPDEFFSRYYSESKKTRVLKAFRLAMYKVGLYSKFKAILQKIRESN